MARNKRSTGNYRKPIYEVGSVYGSAPRPSQPHLRPRRTTNSYTWVWGCAFLGVILCVGMCALTAVLTPIAFRILPQNVQASIARRLPVFTIFMEGTETPDASLEIVPTLDPARATAAALVLLNPQAIGTPTPVLGTIITPTPPRLLVGPTSIPTQTGTPRPTATSQPLPVDYHVGAIQREAQTWNNCGPANLVQGMRVLGANLAQKTAADWLKPNFNDANVSPWQLAVYANDYTEMRALVRLNGTIELLKRLVYNGFGVLIETGLYHPDDGSWLGHYLTVVGWDDVGDSKGGFIYGLDSFEDNGRDGKGVHEHYADLDERWKHFNRVYIVVYRPDQDSALREILGTAMDEQANIQDSLMRALSETRANPADPFAWFNVGTTYVLMGDYPRAVAAYDRSRSVGGGWPWRMLWYQFGPYVAYYETGDYQMVVTLADTVIKRIKYIEEAFYYRGLAHAALGKQAQAIADLKLATNFNPNLQAAGLALSQLEAGQQPVPEVL